MSFTQRTYTYPVLVELDMAQAEEKILATLASKERLKWALLAFFEGKEFYEVDSKGPSLSDLVELGLVSKTYGASSRGNVKNISYKNKSGTPINYEGRVYQSGEFFDLY